MTKLTVTVEEAARMLGIGRSLAYEAVRTGRFPVPIIKVGARYLIPRAPLEVLLVTGVVSPSFDVDSSLDHVGKCASNGGMAA